MDSVLLWCAVGVGWCGVLIARWSVVSGALLAATGSLVVSAALAQRGGLDNAVLFRGQAWLNLAELLALGLLAGRATRSLPPAPLTATLVPIAAAIVAITEWRQGTSSNTFINSALLIGLGGCVGAGGLLRRSDRARTLAAVQARQDERLAIARELHDVVAHHVSAMVVQAQAGQLVVRTEPDRTLDALASIERAGTEALVAMRRMVGAMRTEDAAPTTPAATLAELGELARLSGELGLPVHLIVRHTDVPADVARAVHRVVREALTNARRHATTATAVEVRVERRGSSLDVLVVDDGRAGSGRGEGGFGLVGMAERVEALGGTFAAGPAPGGGWRVEASFPNVIAPGSRAVTP